MELQLQLYEGYYGICVYELCYWVDWLALHLKFGSVYFQQFGGISRPHVDQLQI